MDKRPADPNDAFSWLGDDLIERIGRGVPLVVFGAGGQFGGAGDKPKQTSKRFREFMGRLPELCITKLGVLGDNDPTHGNKQLRTFFDDVRGGRPGTLFVEDRLAALLAMSCDLLDGVDKIERVLLADRLVSAAVTGAIYVDIATSRRPSIFSDLPPLTPIEEMLLKAMDAEGMEVSCQVGFEPYVVDFLVASGANRLVVEADGAAFHDAEADSIRDSYIRERHGLETLRFSGSEIYADASQCASRVKRTMNAGAQVTDPYTYEGLETLDPSQRAAVEHFGGDARVLAPAGSGKTKVLVNRIVWLINHGVSASSLLVLAFNRKAASQLEDRLATLGVPVGKGREGDEGVWIATLNSFGNRVLANEGITRQLLDRPWKEKQLVEEATKVMGESLGGMRGEDPLSILTREIARVRRGLRSPAGIQVEVSQPSGKRSIAIDTLWSAVRSIQERKGVITFDDQIYLATELLAKEPVLRRNWQRRFKHVLVDEYQDLNDAQITLMRILTSGGASIFAVGDDDQMIYSWRDANVVNLLDSFEHAYPGVTDHLLEVNYRCAKPIVRTSQRLISRNQHRQTKRIKPAESAPDGRISFSQAEGAALLGDDLVEFLNEERSNSGRRWQEMAVLTRTNIQLLSAAVALDRAGIPRGALPRIRLFSTPAAKRLYAYLCLIRDGIKGMRGEDLADIVNRPNRFVQNEDVERLRNSHEPWISLNLLAYGCPETKKPNKELQALILELGELIAMATEEAPSAVDVVDSILARFQFSTKPDDSIRTAEEATDDFVLHVMREEARDHVDIDDLITHMSRQARGEMGEAPEEPDREGQSSLEVEKEDQDVVVLSTIHGAKGREWPVVCMFDASRPASNTQRSDTEVEEERRVFYVGMTRAALRLHFSCVTGAPERFLVEAFLPDELIGKGPHIAAGWIRGRIDLLERIRRRSDDTETALRAAEDELSSLVSGEKAVALGQRRSVLIHMRDDLQSQMTNLSRERPVGLIKRIFKDGRSSKSITREMSVFGSRLDSLDAQVRSIDVDIETTQTQPDKLMERAQAKILDLRSAIQSSRDERLDVEGEMSDVETVWQHLPLG